MVRPSLIWRHIRFATFGMQRNLKSACELPLFVLEIMMVAICIVLLMMFLRCGCGSKEKRLLLRPREGFVDIL
jgi:hypothetical protein